MIRSMLIAGMHNEENQYQRFCDDLWLKTEHVPESRAGISIPSKYDAALVATDIASHGLFHAVKSAYEGKPVFLARNGISFVREMIEKKIFGEEALMVLRQPLSGAPGRTKDVMPVSLRMWWVLANFREPGETIKLKDVIRFFEKNLIRGCETALAHTWMKGKRDGTLIPVSNDTAIFTGIREQDYQNFLSYNLTCPETALMKNYGGNFSIKPIIRRESAAEIFRDTDREENSLTLPDEKAVALSTEKAEKTDEGTPAAYEILLDEIVRQQDEIKQLRSLIETKIPGIIQAEIQGVTRLLTLNEKLNGIGPDEAAKFWQVLEILHPKRA